MTVIEKAAETLIAQGLLGAVAILALGVAWWSLGNAKKAYDDRITDKKDAARELRAFADRYVESVSEWQKAVHRLKDVDKDMLGEQARVTTEMNQLKTEITLLRATVDSVIREAVKGRRTWSAPAMEAIRRERERKE